MRNHLFHRLPCKRDPDGTTGFKTNWKTQRGVHGFLESDQRWRTGRSDFAARVLVRRVRVLLSAASLAARFGQPDQSVVVAGLERVQLGPDAVQAALNQATLLEEERIGRGLATLSTIAQIAPMLGLLGTVFGMIRTFSVFSSIAQPTPTQLAGGISEALVTTATGLIVAVLAHLGHSTLARQFEAVFSNVDQARESLTGWLIEAGLQANSTRTVEPLEVSMSWPTVEPTRG
jgi:biopolymer transport protein ExbB/TolQ